MSILYETYFKLIIATGMRRGECCALKWEDINYAERSIHVCRNAVKTTGDEIIVKAPKTKAGKPVMCTSPPRWKACSASTKPSAQRKRSVTTGASRPKHDYVFRRKGMKLPMTPSTFTWRFKKILKANDLPTDLKSQPAPHGSDTVHRQRHGCRHGCRTSRTQPTVDHAGYLHPRL